MAAAREKNLFEASRSSIDDLVDVIKSKPAINFFYRIGLQPCTFSQAQINPAGIGDIANEAVDRMADYFAGRCNQNQPLLSEVAGLDYLANQNPFTYAPRSSFDLANRTYGGGNQFYQAMAHYSLTNGMLQSVKQEAINMQREITDIDINNGTFPTYLKAYNNRNTVQWIDEISTNIITDSGTDSVIMPAPSGKQLTMALTLMYNDDFYNAIQLRINAIQYDMMTSWETLVRTVPKHWLTNMAAFGYIDNLLITSDADVETSSRSPSRPSTSSRESTAGCSSNSTRLRTRSQRSTCSGRLSTTTTSP